MSESIEIIEEKWQVRGTMTASHGQRVTRTVTVFAKGRGEARVTAKRIWGNDGNRKIIINGSIQQ